MAITVQLLLCIFQILNGRSFCITSLCLNENEANIENANTLSFSRIFFHIKYYRDYLFSKALGVSFFLNRFYGATIKLKKEQQFHYNRLIWHTLSVYVQWSMSNLTIKSKKKRISVFSTFSFFLSIFLFRNTYVYNFFVTYLDFQL